MNESERIFETEVAVNDGMDRLMTPEEVARILGVSRQTVMRRISDGTFTAVKLGPHRTSPIRIRRSQLVSYLENLPQAEVHY